MSKVSKLWKRLMAKIREWLSGKGEGEGDGEGGGSGGGGSSTRIEPDWCYGGQNGSKTVEDTSADGYRLTSFSFDGKNVKFSGSGKMWGATHANHSARNCLFFKEKGKWYGGFFEWGDDSRRTRAINNITSGYGGWQPARLAAAKEFAFCLTDKGCKNRSNFVTCMKGAKASTEEEEVEVFDPDAIPE